MASHAYLNSRFFGMFCFAAESKYSFFICANCD